MGGAHKFYFLPLPLPPPWEKEGKERGGALWNPLSPFSESMGGSPCPKSIVWLQSHWNKATGHNFSKKSRTLLGPSIFKAEEKQQKKIEDFHF